MLEEQKKVLVTGASGYLALHCISELLENGFFCKRFFKRYKKRKTS